MHVYVYAHYSWVGLLLHELLPRCVATSLWLYCGVQETAIALIAVGGSFVSHRPPDKAPKILSGLQVRPVKHSNTIVIEPTLGTFGCLDHFQTLLGKK